MQNILTIINNIQKNIYSESDLITLLHLSTDEELDFLFKKANQACKNVYGKDVYIRGILEISNYCSKNCNYCGIRRGNKKLERYRIEPDNIISLINDAYKVGYRTLVLQSGEDAYYNDKMAYIIKKVKEKLDIAITLSQGEQESSIYEKWKKAGADRYLLRIETTDPELFKRLHPDDDLEERKECLKTLKKLHYEVGTGIMIGLPGQTTKMLAQDLTFFKRIDADMLGVGPFIPHEDTPLKNFNSTDFNLTLKIVALSRLLIPDANIPATTAMATLDKQGRQKALKAGANVIMPNFTPQQYRKHYKLYDNKICINEGSDDCRNCIEGIAAIAEKKIVIGKGFRKKTA